MLKMVYGGLHVGIIYLLIGTFLRVFAGYQKMAA